MEHTGMVEAHSTDPEMGGESDSDLDEFVGENETNPYLVPTEREGELGNKSTDNVTILNDPRLEALVAKKRERSESSREHIVAFSYHFENGSLPEFFQSLVFSHMVHLDSDIARLEAELQGEALPKIAESTRIIVETPTTPNVRLAEPFFAQAIKTVESIPESQLIQLLKMTTTKGRQGEIRGARAAKMVIIQALRKAKSA